MIVESINCDENGFFGDSEFSVYSGGRGVYDLCQKRGGVGLVYDCYLS